MNSEFERSKPGSDASADLAYAHRLAARLAGRPERRDLCVAQAKIRLERSSSDDLSAQLAQALRDRLRNRPH